MLPPGPPKLSHRDFDPSIPMDIDEDAEMRSEEAAGGVELSSVEINILIYLYLLESDFSHTAFTLLSESNLPSTSLFQHFNPSYPKSKPSSSRPNGASNNQNGSGKNGISPVTPGFGLVDGRIERGELVRKLWKALRWEEVERHVAPNGEPYAQTCPNPFHLLLPHVCPPSLASSVNNPPQPLPTSLRASPAPTRPEVFPPPPEPQPVAGPSRSRPPQNNDHKDREKERNREKDESSQNRSTATQTASGLINKGKRKARRNSNGSDSRNPSPTRSNSPIKSDRRKDKEKKRSRMGNADDDPRKVEEEEEPRKKGRPRRAMIESEPERDDTPEQAEVQDDVDDNEQDQESAKPDTLSANNPKSRSKSPLKLSPSAELRRSAAARGTGNSLWSKEGDVGLFTEHRDVINCLAWNPKNMDVLASGSSDGTVKLWDFHASKAGDTDEKALRSNKKPTVISHKSIESNKKSVTALSWHPDGTMLATGCQDGVGRLSTPSGQLQGIMSYGRGAIRALKFSPDGSLILMAKADFTTTLWALGSDYEQRVKLTYEAHTKEVNDVDWYDNHVFASAGNDHTIFVHRVEDIRPRYTFKGHTDDVTRIAWSPPPTSSSSNRLLASASDDGTVKIWRLPSYPEKRATPAISTKSNSPFKDDGDNINNYHKKEQDNDNWNEGIPGREDYLLHTLVVVEEGVENKRMKCLEWWPGSGKDGGNSRMILAAGGLDSTIKLFDALTGECLHVLEGLESGTGSIAFSPYVPGKGLGWIAGGGWNSDFIVWDIETGRKLKEYGLTEDRQRQETRDKPMMMSMTWRDDGQHVVVGMQNKMLMSVYVGDLGK